MKKIIKNIMICIGIVLICILMALTVFADTQVGIGVSTDTDMYADIDLDAGGDLYTNIWVDANGNKHTYINGVDVNYEDPSDSTGLTRNVVFRDLYAGIYGIRNGKIFLETALNDKASNIGRLLYNTFWTRIEQYKYQRDMDLRVTVIENTLEQVAPEIFCEVKKDYMEMYNMTSVPCGSETHYKNGIIIGDFVPNMEGVIFKSLGEKCVEDGGCASGICEEVCTNTRYVVMNHTEEDYDEEIITKE